MDPWLGTVINQRKFPCLIYYYKTTPESGTLVICTKGGLKPIKAPPYKNVVKG